MCTCQGIVRAETRLPIPGDAFSFSTRKVDSHQPEKVCALWVASAASEVCWQHRSTHTRACALFYLTLLILIDKHVVPSGKLCCPGTESHAVAIARWPEGSAKSNLRVYKWSHNWVPDTLPHCERTIVWV